MQANEVFLFGKSLHKIAPNLQLKIGDKVEITKNESDEIVKIEKIN